MSSYPNRLVTAALGATAFLLVWLVLANSAFVPWNSIRTFLGVAVGEGIPTYLGRDNASIFGQYYPPLGWWFFSPSALADNPTSAIQIAALINVTFIAVAIFFALLMGGLIRSKTTFSFSLFVLMLMWMMFPTTFYLLSQIHIDSVALCFLMLALYLSYSASCAQKKTVLLCAAGVCLAISIWVKQTMLFALPAFYWLLWPTSRTKHLILFSLSFTLSVLLLGVGLIAKYGFDNLAFHILELPGSTPIVSPFHAFISSLLESITLVLCLLAAILFVQIKSPLKLNRSTLNRLFKSPEYWHLIVAFAFLPISIWSRMRYGGNVNSLLFVPFLIFAFAHSLARFSEKDRSTLLVLQNLALLLGVVTLIKVGIHFPSIELRQPLTSSWHRLISSESRQQNPTHQAYQFLIDSEQATLFPSFPLAHWLANGVATPYEVAVCERHIIFGQAVEHQKISTLIGFRPTSLYYPPLNRPKCRTPHYMAQQYFPNFVPVENRAEVLVNWSKYSVPE